MRIFEKVLFGIILGAIAPILGFLAGWWGALAFMPERLIFFGAIVGLLIGILVDIVCLGRWIRNAYLIHLKIWMAVYLFYSIGMFGFFMGVPIFNVLLGISAGMFVGSKLARQAADREDVKRMNRNTCIFTTGILAIVCVLSAVVALVDPYTSSNIQGMLGLPFVVTREMLVAIIAIGGIALLLLQWGITGTTITLTYTYQTNSNAMR